MGSVPAAEELTGQKKTEQGRRPDGRLPFVLVRPAQVAPNVLKWILF